MRGASRLAGAGATWRVPAFAAVQDRWCAAHGGSTSSDSEATE